MPVACWRVGLPTRCGICLSEEIDYRDDGAATCRACGSVTASYWTRSKGTLSAGRPLRERPGVLAMPTGPPPLAPPPLPIRTGPPTVVVDWSRRLLWVAVPVHLLAAAIPLLLLGGVPELAWFVAMGAGVQISFAIVAVMGALWLLRSSKTFYTPMIIVGIVAMIFSGVVYGGIVGIIAGALTMVAWYRVRPGA